MNKSFIAGLICGEGCFSHYFSYRKGSEGYPEWRFSISMHERDYEMLKEVHEYMGFGKFKPITCKKSCPQWRIECVSQKEQVEKVIPFFNGILTGHKKTQFDYYKKTLLDYYAGRKQRKSEGGKKSAKNR